MKSKCTHYTADDFTFVVCAYKENPKLEDCILSLINQRKKAHIIVSTSTPNVYIDSICKKYNLKLHINKGIAGIAYDWNYGYNQAKTDLVTIAHQDDVYDDNYVEEVLKYANKGKDIQILYTDYYELRDGVREDSNKLLKIKRLMNLPLRPKMCWGNRFIRKRILSFGNPICCPAVTINKSRCGSNVFYTPYKNSCDYMTWATLAKKNGQFIYIPKKLMAHSIYAGSTTTQNIHENIRAQEDFEILCMFWPNFLAKLIFKFYSKGMDSNNV